ncbi:unnamed protein product [Schistocephalus solidus]|uniref:Uncharacterized protein n=1 Tax=Schistocephalus solidus TaxID=70667 RepID=A0A183TGT7_SCHSO|nr:unnamed protein product [Schistocephalus solidus]
MKAFLLVSFVVFALLLLLVNPNMKTDAAAITSPKSEVKNQSGLLIQPVSASNNSSEKAVNLRLSKVVRLLELFVALLHVEDMGEEGGPVETEFRAHKL